MANVTHAGDGYIDERRQSKARIEAIIFGTIGLLFGIYSCFRANAYIADHPDTSPAQAFFMAMTESAEKPFDLKIDDGVFQFAPVLLIIIAAIFIYIDTSRLLRHFASDEIAGTAKFMDMKMIKKYNMQFTEPYGKPTSWSKKEGEIDSRNTIYSKHCALTMNTRHSGLNNNAMIIGGPGSGKSFNIVRPNLLQAYGSYVVTDPSGELRDTTGRFFEERGYDIRIFNLTDMLHSHRYNPFNYIRSEEDVLTLIQCLIKNTDDGGQKGGDPFWEKSEMALLEAIIFYLIRYKDKSKQNFATVSSYLRMAKADPKKMQTKLDLIFDAVRQVDPDDICIKQYDIFKQASDKTAQSILITAAVRLAPFNIEAVQNLTNEDDMNLKTIGDKPTITYIIVPQGNNPYAFLVNMMYTQMFDTLYDHAAKDCPGLRLKNDVRFILDEFANIGIIPGFQVKLTTMRKYGLSCMIFIQAVGQIKNLYKDDWETLMGACDTMVYLGGNELSSMEDLSKKLGDMTARDLNKSHTRSNTGTSSNTSIKGTKRALMTVDEIRRMKPGSCIAVIKGQQPFYDEKYKTFDHKNAKLLGDLGSGKRIYKFAYCNASPKSIDKLAKNKEKLQNYFMKQSAASTRKSEKAVASHDIVPGLQFSQDQRDHMGQTVAKNTSSFHMNEKESMLNGAEITRVEKGISLKKSMPASSVSSGGPAEGKIAKPKVSTDSSNNLMDELDKMFGA